MLVRPAADNADLVRCPFCHETGVCQAVDAVVCTQCFAIHHHACWREGTGCACCRSDNLSATLARKPFWRRWFLGLTLGPLILVVVLVLVVNSNSAVTGRPTHARCPQPADLHDTRSGKSYNASAGMEPEASGYERSIVERARSELKNGRYAEAKDLLARGVQYRVSGDLWAWLGLAHLALGEREQAQASVSRACSIRSEGSLEHAARGIVRRETGDTAGSLRDLEQAASAADSAESIRFAEAHLGLTKDVLGDPFGACQAYNRALAEVGGDSSYAWVYARRASLRFQSGDAFGGAADICAAQMLLGRETKALPVPSSDLWRVFDRQPVRPPPPESEPTDPF